MDQHQKLRLKVTTNTGLNLMCTVYRDWTVEQLYPHITKLYKQVTEDQESNHNIQLTSLKKNSYYIPKSQIVGDIFTDGDQVSCNVETAKTSIKVPKDKKQVKRQKAEEKRNEQQSPIKPIKNEKKQERQKQSKQKQSKQSKQPKQPKQPKPQQKAQSEKKQKTQDKKQDKDKKEPQNLAQQQRNELKDKQKKNKKKNKNKMELQDSEKLRTIPEKAQLLKVFFKNQHKIEEEAGSARPNESHSVQPSGPQLNA